MIRIGTRGSKLALWQANHVQSLLTDIGQDAQQVIIKTKGDQIQELSFDKIEGKGFFTKEIEDALINESIDVAVHSLKDLPTEMHPELAITGLSSRANPADLLIFNKNSQDSSRRLGIKLGAIVGTSSIRRKVQLFDFDPNLKIVDIRGNVPTRINKIAEGVVDGIVIAAAGVSRLDIDLSAYKVLEFNPLEFIPAPAQGVIGFQCRRKDQLNRNIVKQIHQNKVALSTNVERKILNLLDGGCQLPLGAYCEIDGKGHYHVHAVLGSEIGKPLKRVSYSQSTHVDLAKKVVDKLHEST